MHSIIALSLALSSIVPVGGKVVYASFVQGVDPAIAAKVIECESNFRTDVYGDHGLAYGPAQFHKDTFDWFKKLAGAPALDYRDPNDQIVLFVWGLANGYEKHWTCHGIVMAKMAT